MDKETKRTFQRMIEIMQEQQAAIRYLQGNTTPSMRKSEDGLADRIEAIFGEVSRRESFTIDWVRLCDRHYASRD